MSEDLFPESGARFLFELDESSADHACYGVRALMADETTHQGVGRITQGSETIEIEGLEGSPDWVRTFSQRFLRQVAAGQRGASEPRWPRRLLRWRSEP